MKKLISLLSLLSLFSFAVACNMDNDRQDEEVRGMETNQERVEDQTNEAGMEDQRMEDTYQENQNQINEDIERTEENVEGSEVR